jgi:hypothetical protein
MLEPNGRQGVECLHFRPAAARNLRPNSLQLEETMVITAAEFSPIIALIAGVLILLIPRLLNFIVAIYLIVEGLVGLNAVHHFLR